MHINLKGEDKHDFDNPNPFIQSDEDTNVASVGYR